MQHFLDFEKPIAELEGKIEELRRLTGEQSVDLDDDIQRMTAKLEKLLRSTYSRLSPWQKTQVARHPNRPHFLDYVHLLVEDFMPLAGDRNFAEDEAILGGLGRWRGYSAMILGQERGHDTASRLRHNFGMARPEGYRKAQRLMRMAERFQIPVISLVDTAGAYPGIDAEARGQAEAIAQSIATCLDLQVPIISVIIGEGGSGGAIAIATGNQVFMLESAIYSVISPEGCASILWRSASEAQTAAEALRLTAEDLRQLGVIDDIIREPLGGAHRDHQEAAQNLGDKVEAALKELTPLDGPTLVKQRRQKFLDMGRRGLN